METRDSMRIDVLFKLKGIELDTYGRVLGIHRKASMLVLISKIFQRWPFQETDSSYRARIMDCLVSIQVGRTKPFGE